MPDSSDIAQHDRHEITTLTALEAIYPPVGTAARRKEIDYLHPVYQAMIEASPFVVLATNGPEGPDCSPRGDPGGFVKIRDTQTLWLPDRPGNNRIDSLRNLLHDPNIALLFLIPGRNETLRVNGVARITRDPQILSACAMDGKEPRCVIVVSIRTVFFQCGRAALRAGLWTEPNQDVLTAMPSTGRMLEELTQSEIRAQDYDRDLDARQRNSLY